jgi:hypothetical protein
MPRRCQLPSSPLVGGVPPLGIIREGLSNNRFGWVSASPLPGLQFGKPSFCLWLGLAESGTAASVGMIICNAEPTFAFANDGYHFAESRQATGDRPKKTFACGTPNADAP